MRQRGLGAGRSPGGPAAVGSPGGPADKRRGGLGGRREGVGAPGAKPVEGPRVADGGMACANKAGARGRRRRLGAAAGQGKDGRAGRGGGSRWIRPERAHRRVPLAGGWGGGGGGGGRLGYPARSSPFYLPGPVGLQGGRAGPWGGMAGGDIKRLACGSTRRRGARVRGEEGGGGPSDKWRRERRGRACLDRERFRSGTGLQVG